jgi:hypothetical protein
MIDFGGAAPKPPGFSAFKTKACDRKSKRPHCWVRPSCFDHPIGARVAPQRCPIPREGAQKIKIKKYYSNHFLITLDGYLYLKTGILIVVKGKNNCR